MNENDRYQLYRSAIACCANPADELVVEALYTTPTLDLAAAVAAILAPRYTMTAAEVLEDMYA